jgi:hypothetical protein
VTKSLAMSLRLSAAALIVAALMIVGGAATAQVVDEARQAGRTPQSLPPADEDYFHAMDGGISLTPDEVKGRNMWILWTGGDDRLWDDLTNLTFGSLDLLKTLSSYPGSNSAATIAGAIWVWSTSRAS